MNRKTLAIRAALSLAFFVVLFRAVERAEFARVVRQMDPLYVALAFGLTVVMIGSSCLKWKVILDQMGHRIPFGFLMRTYMVGYYFSALLPSNVGGDVVRSYYIGCRIRDQARSAISIFIERFSGVLFLLVLVIVAPLWGRGLYARPAFVLPAVSAALLLAAVAWIGTFRHPFKLPDRLARAVLRALRTALSRIGAAWGPRALDAAERLYDKVVFRAERFHGKLIRAVASLGTDRAALMRVLLLTFWYYALTWVNIYLAFRVFGVRPPFWRTAAIVPTAMFVATLPVTLLGNLGFTEGVYVFFFSLTGMSQAAVLAMSLFMRLKFLVTGTVGYLFYLTYPHARGEVEQLRRAAEEEQGPAGGAAGGSAGTPPQAGGNARPEPVSPAEQ